MVVASDHVHHRNLRPNSKQYLRFLENKEEAAYQKRLRLADGNIYKTEMKELRPPTTEQRRSYLAKLKQQYNGQEVDSCEELSVDTRVESETKSPPLFHVSRRVHMTKAKTSMNKRKPIQSCSEPVTCQNKSHQTLECDRTRLNESVKREKISEKLSRIKKIVKGRQEQFALIGHSDNGTADCRDDQHGRDNEEQRACYENRTGTEKIAESPSPDTQQTVATTTSTSGTDYNDQSRVELDRQVIYDATASKEVNGHASKDFEETNQISERLQSFTIEDVNVQPTVSRNSSPTNDLEPRISYPLPDKNEKIRPAGKETSMYSPKSATNTKKHLDDMETSRNGFTGGGLWNMSLMQVLSVGLFGVNQVYVPPVGTVKIEFAQNEDDVCSEVTDPMIN